MVGESDTVSQTFSSARTGLFWIGGFLFIFLVVAIVATVFNEISGNPSSASSRTSGASTPRSTGAPRQNEPSMGLTPETAAQP